MLRNMKINNKLYKKYIRGIKYCLRSGNRRFDHLLEIVCETIRECLKNIKKNNDFIW